MSDVTASPRSTRLQAADWLWFSAHSILNVMPVAMAISHRSSTLFVALATVAALGGMAAEGLLRPWGAEAAGVLKRPIGLVALAFLGFAALSITWSVAPQTSLRAYAEFVLTLAGGFILAFTLPRRMPRQGPLYLATSVALACAIIIVDMALDFPVRRFWGARPQDFIFNRPVLTILVLTIPLIWLLVRWRHAWAAWTVLAVVTATVLQSASGAAVLGLVAAAATYAISRLSGRVGVRVVGAVLCAAILVAPATGELLDRVLPPPVHDTLASAHSQVRVEIWKNFGEAVRRDPVFGAGFGVSPRFSETTAARELAPDDPARFDSWHPHNAALQTWVELGGIGAALALALVVLLLLRIAALPEEPRMVGLMLLATTAAVSLVGHGAWQGWWAAAIAAAVVWLRYGRHAPTGMSR
jgi:O-antigen ligase